MKYPHLALPCVAALSALSCSPSADLAPDAQPGVKIVDVDPSYFVADALIEPITIETHRLSGGTDAPCYVIKTRSLPQEHPVGPFTPTTLADDKDAGGIWFKDGEVHDVDGPFIKNMAKLYDDDAWMLYCIDGSVRITETQEAFEAAARPDVAPEFNNHVVEGRAEWVEGKVTTTIIPVTPVYTPAATALGGNRPRGGRPPRGERPGGPPPGRGEPGKRGERRGPGGGGGGQGGVGLAFNGVNFDPPAPLDAVLAAHTLAPFDDAGGHFNPHTGYHYHAATGHTKEVAQSDGHAPMIGYAIDGFGIYAHLDDADSRADGLDSVNGHSDGLRGYHYHAGPAGGNQVLKGFHGETGSITVAD